MRAVPVLEHGPHGPYLKVTAVAAEELGPLLGWNMTLSVVFNGWWCLRMAASPALVRTILSVSFPALLRVREKDLTCRPNGSIVRLRAP